MQREGSLIERLGAWLKSSTGEKPPRPIYAVVDTSGGSAEFSIEETEDPGRANVRCSVPPEHTCVVFYFHGQNSLFGFLRESKNADGAVLFTGPAGELSAWIVELKRTVDQKKWDEIYKQFTWTLARLLAIAGVIGLELASVSFATGFRDDRLSPEESPNPAFGKAPLGETGETQMTGARRRQIAWVEDTIRLPGIVGSFRHTKIRLDDDGNGSCRLGG